MAAVSWDFAGEEEIPLKRVFGDCSAGYITYVTD
jgi:hypothetical protein